RRAACGDAVAELLCVARAGRRPADDRGRGERVGRTARGGAIAALGQIAWSGGGAADLIRRSVPAAGDRIAGARETDAAAVARRGEDAGVAGAAAMVPDRAGIAVV